MQWLTSSKPSFLILFRRSCTALASACRSPSILRASLSDLCRSFLASAMAFSRWLILSCTARRERTGQGI